MFPGRTKAVITDI